MKAKKQVVIASLGLMVFLAACGGKNSKNSGVNSASESTEEKEVDYDDKLNSLKTEDGAKSTASSEESSTEVLWEAPKDDNGNYIKEEEPQQEEVWYNKDLNGTKDLDVYTLEIDNTKYNLLFPKNSTVVNQYVTYENSFFDDSLSDDAEDEDYREYEVTGTGYLYDQYESEDEFNAAYKSETDYMVNQVKDMLNPDDQVEISDTGNNDMKVFKVKGRNSSSGINGEVRYIDKKVDDKYRCYIIINATYTDRDSDKVKVFDGLEK